MKTEKNINLTAYTVEYIDQREPKPRTIRTQTVVLDGGKVSALARLDMRPAGWITQQFGRDGYTVASVHKGETIAAHVDLADLWQAYENNLKRLALEKQNLVTAKENYYIANERFMLGDLAGIEIREAQNSLLDAEERILVAEYDTKICEISLRQLSGSIMEYIEE